MSTWPSQDYRIEAREKMHFAFNKVPFVSYMINSEMSKQHGVLLTLLLGYFETVRRGASGELRVNPY